jgi:hypothetical protein
MEILVRSVRGVLKILLFLGLYALTLRFVHTYPIPMPPDQQHVLLTLSRKLGVRDPDDLYVYTFAVVDLIIATVVYMTVMRFWRIRRKRQGCTSQRH